MAEYCLKNNKNNEEEVSNILIKEYQGSISDHRLAIFLLISEIFIETGRRREIAFFKCLSKRTQVIIADLAGSDLIKLDR